VHAYPDRSRCGPLSISVKKKTKSPELKKDRPLHRKTGLFTQEFKINELSFVWSRNRWSRFVSRWRRNNFRSRCCFAGDNITGSATNAIYNLTTTGVAACVIHDLTTTGVATTGNIGVNSLSTAVSSDIATDQSTTSTDDSSSGSGLGTGALTNLSSTTRHDWCGGNDLTTTHSTIRGVSSATTSHGGLVSIDKLTAVVGTVGRLTVLNRRNVGHASTKNWARACTANTLPPSWSSHRQQTCHQRNTKNTSHLNSP
jgi:hypothetical protein